MSCPHGCYSQRLLRAILTVALAALGTALGALCYVLRMYGC